MPAKLNKKERLRLIERVIIKGEPVTKVCQEAKISRTLFYRWLKRYSAEGKVTSRAPGRPIKKTPPKIKKKITPFKKLSPQKKLEMVEQVVKYHQPVSKVCLDFRLSRPSLYKWLKRYHLAQKDKKLEAMEDKKPQISRYSRQTPAMYEKVVLDAVAQHPQLGVKRILEVLPRIADKPIIGYHGVQNILRRHDLNTFQKRLDYAQTQITPVTRLISFFEELGARFIVLPAETRTKTIRFAAIALLTTFSTIFVLGVLGHFAIIVGAAPIPSRIGLFLATSALLIGSFFFAYSIKYYLTLAVVLSFSRQAGEEGMGIGLKTEIKKTSRDLPASGWLQKIFGLGNGEERQETIQAGGLQPSLDHIKLKRYPFVSIHLPFFNEKKVAERILKACTAMDYPRESYEIIVCDDSNDETINIVQRYVKKHNQTHPKGPKIKVLHRPTREGFKGGALSYALKSMDKKTEFCVVFDADFIPYPDTLELFVKYFKVNNGQSENYTRGKIAVVGGYQWHVLNKSENWITRGVRTEYAGSYVIERPGREILGLLKQISGSVYMIRSDVIKKVGWGTSITEDFQLTLKLYEQGYKVIYTPYVQAPAECVSTLKRLIRQRMRWAEGHSNNIRRMFLRLMLGREKRDGQGRKTGWIPSPLTLGEKLELLYLTPYYLQAFFFLAGTLSWLLAEAVFRVKLPFWTSLWGWSLVLTNFFCLPLVNAVGLFLEESEERDYLGIFSFTILSYVLVPFQAYASVKGFLEKEEGPWFRTPKTGRITDIFTRGRFYRWIAGILPGRGAVPAYAEATTEKHLSNSYLALATANHRFNSFEIRPKRNRFWGKLALFLVVAINSLLSFFGNQIPQGAITNLPIQARVEVISSQPSLPINQATLSQILSLFKPRQALAATSGLKEALLAGEPVSLENFKGLVLFSTLLSLSFLIYLARKKRTFVKKLLRPIFVFVLVASWLLTSFPAIWFNPRFPPKIKEVEATDYDDVVLATNGGPDYRIQFNGNITEEIKSQGTSGAPDSYVTNIIPNDDGQCADYAASAETVITNASDVNSSTTTRKTVSFWVEIDTFGTGTGSNARNIWEEGGATNWFGAYTANNDELYIIIGESGANKGYCYTDGLSTGTLYHVVMQWQGSDDAMELWINGSLVDSTTASIGSELSSHTGDWEIGGNAESFDHTDTDIGLLFDGKIADYSYWAEAADFLTEAEIVAIYEAGAVVAPSAPTLYNDDGGSNQIAFNNIRENDTSPIIRASATHDTTFNTFFVEFNTASDFSGTAYTETFSGTYSSGTAYNLQTTGSLNLPSNDGVTYYVRVKASDDGGTDYGDWSTTLACCGTWTYTYTSSAGDSEWLQTTDEQFDTGTMVSTQTSGSDSVEIVGSETTIYLTSGTTWNVPADWNSSNNTIRAIGAGGDGGLSTASSNSGGGGGGGEYRAATNVTLTPSSTVDINIPSGGDGSSADGAWIENNSDTIVVEAKNGGNASGTTAGSGGTGGTGTAANYDGGAGGAGASNSTASGGGGGGSAGPSGAGKAGGDGVGSTNYGAGGGGGSNGGSSTVGETPTGPDGGDGGVGTGGTGGGAGGVEHTSGGSNGTDGGGGGGGADTQSSTPSPGGNGACDTAWDSTHGACGGGGGGGGASGTAGTADRDGGTGGTYGGGGGGCGISGSLDTGECDGTGVGGQGIIVITYTPDASSGTIMSPEIDYDWFDGASAWNDVYWSEDETHGTIMVQVYYNDCGTIIPDEDLSGNSSGFTTGPIDISGLSTSTYNEICFKATLADSGGSPYLEDWGVSVPESLWLFFGLGPFLPFVSRLKRKRRKKL